MKRHVVGVLALALVAYSPVADAEPDEAPETSGDIGRYLVIGVLALDAALTIHDVVTIGDDTPTVYGVAETMLAVPQVLVFGGISLLEGDTGGVGWLAVWAAGLATHGALTIAAGDGEPEAPRMFSLGGRF